MRFTKILKILINLLGIYKNPENPVQKHSEITPDLRMTLKMMHEYLYVLSNSVRQYLKKIIDYPMITRQNKSHSAKLMKCLNLTFLLGLENQFFFPFEQYSNLLTCFLLLRSRLRSRRIKIDNNNNGPYENPYSALWLSRFETLQRGWRFVPFPTASPH